MSRADVVLDGYCSTVQGLLDWFEVDLGFTELLFSQIDKSRCGVATISRMLKNICLFAEYMSLL